MYFGQLLEVLFSDWKADFTLMGQNVYCFPQYDSHAAWHAVGLLDCLHLHWINVDPCLFHWRLQWHLFWRQLP